MNELLQKAQDWLKTNGVEFAFHLVAALAIFIIGRWIAHIVKKVLEGVLNRRRVEPTITKFTGNLAFIALLTFVIIAALGQVGIQTSSFIAVIGAAGLAIGLALQGALSNFAAGFLLILFRYFKKGDYIAGAGVEGVVDEIQVFCTILTTADNKQVIIPNSKLTSDNIINFTAREHRMIHIPLNVSFTEDSERVRRALLALAAGDARILPVPAPMVGLNSIADGMANYTFRVWAKTPDYWTVYFETTERVKNCFQTEGISLPATVRHIYMHDTNRTGT